jgi:hypothetical protein
MIQELSNFISRTRMLQPGQLPALQVIEQLGSAPWVTKHRLKVAKSNKSIAHARSSTGIFANRLAALKVLDEVVVKNEKLVQAIGIRVGSDTFLFR